MVSGVAVALPSLGAELNAGATALSCPNCSLKMISRRSTHEGRKFWGCPNYPRCKQTLHSTADAPA